MVRVVGPPGPPGAKVIFFKYSRFNKYLNLNNFCRENQEFKA